MSPIFSSEVLQAPLAGEKVPFLGGNCTTLHIAPQGKQSCFQPSLPLVLSPCWLAGCSPWTPPARGEGALLPMGMVGTGGDSVVVKQAWDGLENCVAHNPASAQPSQAQMPQGALGSSRGSVWARHSSRPVRQVSQSSQRSQPGPGMPLRALAG